MRGAGGEGGSILPIRQLQSGERWQNACSECLVDLDRPNLRWDSQSVSSVSCVVTEGSGPFIGIQVKGQWGSMWGSLHIHFCIHVYVVTQARRLHTRTLKFSPWLLTVLDVMIISLVLTALSVAAKKLF